MRYLLAVCALSLFGQTVADDAALREASAAVVAALGQSLTVYREPLQIPRASMFPSGPEAGEALITDREIFVSRSQLQQFSSAKELAGFLFHATAHARLGHVARWASVMEAERFLPLTHAPGKYSENLAVRVRAEMEAEANKSALELVGRSGCGATGCRPFERLRDAVRE